MRRVEVLDNAFTILEAFNSDNPELGLREIAERTGIPHPTVHRLISTMREHDFIDQNATNKKYRLGTGVIRMGAVALGQFSLRDAAKPFMESLSQRTRQAVYLAIPVRHEVVYIDKVDGPDPVQISLPLGSQPPVHCTAVGRAILAFQPEDIIDAAVEMELTRYSEATLTDAVALRRELAIVRERGYAMNQGGWWKEVVGVAAPIFDHSNRVVGGLNIFALAAWLPERYEEVLPNLIVEAAQGISTSLGCKSYSNAVRRC